MRACQIFKLKKKKYSFIFFGHPKKKERRWLFWEERNPPLWERELENKTFRQYINTGHYLGEKSEQKRVTTPFDSSSYIFTSKL